MSSVFPSGLLLLALIFPQTGATTPIWIEHASQPGPDTPPGGMSRFDQLFLHTADRYQLPHPFTKLIRMLESRIDNGDKNGVRQVLVPIGRSLQRDSPAPDYFHFPRAVITLEGEPATGDDDAGLVLEYRLFIAHQPKTESLEVISYNDEIGRFEFQVVENYAAGKSPTVRQANRVMCMSCHQNAAPIFAQRPWQETSFNVEVANRLIQTLPQRYESLIDLVTEDADIIDLLTERANYLSAAQFIWKHGCTSRRCRAAILSALLQYRLSGEASFDWNSRSYRQNYYAELDRNWKRQWPQGLALAASRIDDRDPFSQDPLSIDQDPLFARPAQANWHQADSILARGIVYRLAGFLTLADIRRLDRRLIELGQGMPTRKHYAKCKSESEPGHTLVLTCGDPAAMDSLRARIEIETQLGQAAALRILQLQIPGDANIWQPTIAGLTQSKLRLDLDPGRDSQGLSPRLSSGSRVRSMAIEAEDHWGTGGFNFEVEIVDEFELVETAIDQLVSDGADGLSARAFRREPLVAGLMQQLGMKALRWPRSSKIQAPIPPRSIADLRGALALMNPYCAHCHGDDSLNPPGFLFAEFASRRVGHCAPRILTRLQAWQPGSGFNRSPMPPVASLGYSDLAQADWPDSDHYRALVDAVSTLVGGEFQGMAYDELPPCLPSD